MDNTKIKMSNLNFKVILLVLIIMTITNGCGEIYNSGLVPIPSQPISGAVEIGTDWTEIAPPEPLEPLGESNKIIFNCSVDETKPIDKEGTKISLKDGTSTNIEAVILDSKGETSELGIGGYGGGFIMYRRNPAKGSLSGEFPKDRTYTKLKIRSQLPVKCESIEWFSYVPK